MSMSKAERAELEALRAENATLKAKKFKPAPGKGKLYLNTDPSKNWVFDGPFTSPNGTAFHIWTRQSTFDDSMYCTIVEDENPTES